MGRNNHLNALLMEILIAVLFFALSATVILETFAAAREQSHISGCIQTALAEAQSLADRLSMSEDMAATLERAGFSSVEGSWTREGEEYTLNVSLDLEMTEAGRMESAMVQATQKEKVLFELPCARYVPGEVAE